MVTRKLIKPAMKPSYKLGFFLGAVVSLLILFVLWESFGPKHSWGQLKAEHVLSISAALLAMCGWLFTNMVNMRNSIRRHTIDTLLQSRLSSTYMRYADILSRHYTDYDIRRKANPALRENPTDNLDIQALRYILNYFEFIAIGIKRGDLDEEMLRDSLKSILRKNVEMSIHWIRRAQLDNPSLFVNLLWLHGRWQLEG